MAVVFISFSSAQTDAALSLQSFLVDHGIDSVFLDRDEDDGILPGADWQRELYREVRACEIMVVLWSREAAASRWCFFERTLANVLGKRFIPVALDATPLESRLAATSQMIGVEPADGRWSRVLRGLERLGIGSRIAFRWDKARAPYPGLPSFDVTDARVFFGRERSTQGVLDIVNQVARHDPGTWIVLVGPSGCGKSSVLRAGVLARLALDGDNWNIVRLLRAGELGRVGLDASSAPARTERQCSVVALDQLEELFDERRAARQLDTELERLRDESATSNVVCIGTLRSDFLAQFQARAAKLSLRFRAVPIEPFPRDALASVVTGPAQVAGLELDSDLVAALLKDASPDSLPLLAFTLRELYERGDRCSLRKHTYDELGGLEGAAANVADRVLASHGLTDARHERFIETLVRLVRVNEKDEPIRRSLRTTEIPSELSPLFQDLVDRRLLVARDDDGPVVELAHEALIRAWAPLRQMVEDERKFFVWYRRFQVLMSSSTSAKLEPDLLRDHNLLEALSWRKEHPSRLTLGERTFIDRSEQQNEAEQQRRLRAAEDLAEVRRIATRRARAGFGVAAALGTLCLLLVVLVARRNRAVEEQRNTADIQRKNAQEKAQRLLANHLAQASDETLRSDPELALLLALAAYDREPSVASRRRLYAAGEPLVRVGGHAAPITSAAWSPAEDIVATASSDGAIRIWNGHGTLERVLMTRNHELRRVAFSKSGQWLASLAEDGEVRLWPRSGGESAVLRTNHDAREIQWSPTDDSLLVSAATGLGIYDARGEPIVDWTKLEVATDWFDVPGPIFSPDGRFVAVITSRTIDVLTLKPKLTIQHLARPNGVGNLRWQSSDRLLLSGKGGTTIAGLDGRTVWHDDSPAALSDFYVGDARGWFLTGAVDKRTQVLHDTDGRELRRVAGKEDDCVLVSPWIYCQVDKHAMVDGARIDFTLEASSWTAVPMPPLLGIAPNEVVCMPEGNRCRNLWVIPPDFMEEGKHRDLAYAREGERVLLTGNKSHKAVMIEPGGRVSELDSGDDMTWLKHEAFLFRHGDASELRNADGRLLAYSESKDTACRSSPSGALVAAASTTPNGVVVRDTNGAVTREISLKQGPVVEVTWGTSDHELAIRTVSANVIVDPLGTGAPLEFAPGEIWWSPRGGEFALQSADFDPAHQRGTVTLHRLGTAPEILFQANANAWAGCSAFFDVLGWSKSGRYFSFCCGGRAFAVATTGKHAIVEQPSCAVAWAATDSWVTVGSADNSDTGRPTTSIHSADGGTPVRVFGAQAQVTWSPRGDSLAVFESPNIEVWSPPNDLKTLARTPLSDGTLAFDSTGTYLAWVSGTRGLIIGIEGGVTNLYLPRPVDAVRWSPNGMLLAAYQDTTGSPAPNATVYVVTRDGQILAELLGNSPQWSATGQRLALRLGSERRIWDMSDKQIEEDRRLVKRKLTQGEQEAYGLREGQADAGSSGP